VSMVHTAERDAAFEAYRDEVYTWAYRLLGRHHDALDVAVGALDDVKSLIFSGESSEMLVRDRSSAGR